MQKNKCVLFCVSLLFLKLFFFLPRAQLETGRAGLGLIFLERQRAGPGRKKRAHAGLYPLPLHVAQVG